MHCIKQQDLIADVERILDKIAKLARMEADSLRTQTENTWYEIDKQIELAIGEKERAIGALREHRKEHGC